MTFFFFFYLQNSPLMQHLVDAGIDIHCETFTLSNEFKREDNGEEISLTYPYINKVERKTCIKCDISEVRSSEIYLKSEKHNM